MLRPYGIVCFAVIASLCACSGVQVVDQSSNSVSIRYDGAFQTLDDAKARAQTVCASQGKTAQLRDTDVKGVADRIAHFNCT
jgi:hypothetical protein